MGRCEQSLRQLAQWLQVTTKTGFSQQQSLIPVCRAADMGVPAGYEARVAET
jgi:hypothetical protein